VRICRIRVDGDLFLARREENFYTVLPFHELNVLLNQDDWVEAANASGRNVSFELAQEEALFEPEHIFCIGLNYKGHIQETGKPTPEYPTVFAKFASSLTGPDSDVELPTHSREVDWEVELGIVIGKSARNVSPEQAAWHIAGYTVINDVSMRDWQSRTNQWFQGKNFEASTPVGAHLVTPDEIDDARDLRISCSIDGQIMQDGRTSDLLFGPTELVSYISQFTTLRPGDLIATGTPSGVGMAKTPKRFLQPGEVLVSEIEGIGRLTNRFVSTGRERT
jgi:acylpyruvate hydrolase